MEVSVVDGGASAPGILILIILCSASGYGGRGGECCWAIIERQIGHLIMMIHGKMFQGHKGPVPEIS